VFRILVSYSILLFFLSSCKKEGGEFIPDNDAPPYSQISSVKLRNYVNRVYIDLLGREPLDDEMNLEVFNLKSAQASVDSRKSLVEKLMFDASFRPGDSSYTYAYFRRVYELSKIRFLEGVSDVGLQGEANIFRNNAISDSLGGNTSGYEENMAQYQKLMRVIGSAEEFKSGVIDFQELSSFMINNSVYDIINMNSFNFVNAAFSDLLFRFPSQNEFNLAYEMVENNQSGSLFGGVASNKDEFVNLIATSGEALQGTIIWTYISLLSREPGSAELASEMLKYGVDKNFFELQKRILISDEYANF
jgi:hypothetical protein